MTQREINQAEWANPDNWSDRIVGLYFSLNRIYVLLVAAYLGFLILLVSLANRGIGCALFAAAGRMPHGDKLGHAVLMGLFAFLLNGAFRCRRAVIAGLPVLVGSLIAVVLVSAEELSQNFIATRGFEWLDLAANLVGIFLFGRLALVNRRLRRANPPR